MWSFEPQRLHPQPFLALAAVVAVGVALASAPAVLASDESRASCCSVLRQDLLVLQDLLACWRGAQRLRHDLQCLRRGLCCCLLSLLELLARLAALLSRPAV